MAKQKINPFLWFNRQAEEAARFYSDVFGNAKNGSVTRQGDAVLVFDLWLGDQKFTLLNGGPQFQINPSISFSVICETEAEIDAAWGQLANGGMVMMPLERYPWSEKYGWVQDRFGVSWQLSLGNLEEIGQKYTPSLMFCGARQGRAAEAMEFYTGLFHNATVNSLLRYEVGEPGPVGQIKHASFTLEGQVFTAMDSGIEQPFTFNEALSFVVHCQTQEEVDYYWNKLTADGGEESMCGWLKDPFGVSWQIVPEALPRLLSDPDPAVAQRAMQAMMQMRKIEIAKLTEAPTDNKTAITIESTVNVPVEKVWTFWTGAEHIQQWNNASEDWHTPKAVNDLQPGGKFVFTMAAKDGSFSFDFGGKYDEVIENQHLAYSLEDGRKVSVRFQASGSATHIVETFDPENMNPVEMQRAGWQAILDNFKKYVEEKG